jgi:hypothetical protein
MSMPARERMACTARSAGQLRIEALSAVLNHFEARFTGLLGLQPKQILLKQLRSL